MFLRILRGCLVGRHGEGGHAEPAQLRLVSHALWVLEGQVRGCSRPDYRRGAERRKSIGLRRERRSHTYHVTMPRRLRPTQRRLCERASGERHAHGPAQARPPPHLIPRQRHPSPTFFPPAAVEGCQRIESVRRFLDSESKRASSSSASSSPSPSSVAKKGGNLSEPFFHAGYEPQGRLRGRRRRRRRRLIRVSVPILGPWRQGLSTSTSTTASARSKWSAHASRALFGGRPEIREGWSMQTWPFRWSLHHSSR